ncbi:hypothetical protein O3P69_000314 [Scylla paramamosain]|uniref:Uncharacterized protein n=1 Tax=Scylla paramamosain TaxID=85552 RepID=A0AAW0UZZ3_SCYPA
MVVTPTEAFVYVVVLVLRGESQYQGFLLPLEEMRGDTFRIYWKAPRKPASSPLRKKDQLGSTPPQFSFCLHTRRICPTSRQLPGAGYIRRAKR